jgi:hypothetical protein
LWGLALLVLALVLALRSMQLLPETVFDLLARAWPALLVLAGLSIILRARVGFGSGIALIVSLLLLGGIAALGFSSRATQQRSDYRETLAQTISPAATLLRVQIRTLATDIELLPRGGGERQVTGEFVGSAESQIEITYNEAGVDGNLLIAEQQASQFPRLENIGRGTLRLELPPDLALDIDLQAASGTVTLNTVGLAVERMNLNLLRGDALVTLPMYDPLASGPEDTLGTLAAREGNITMLIDLDLAAQLELDVGARPIYDPNFYNYLSDLNRLEARNINVADIIVRYAVSAPRGEVIVRNPSE